MVDILNVSGEVVKIKDIISLASRACDFEISNDQELMIKNFLTDSRFEIDLSEAIENLFGKVPEFPGDWSKKDVVLVADEFFKLFDMTPYTLGVVLLHN